MSNALSSLKKIPLREQWESEPNDFTPWLAKQDSLNLLSDALNLDGLVAIETEHKIGDFSLDILCQDADGCVIIENQLEKTDHTHLGQIITYASGVEAKKIIWVAESFRSEHIAAFQFLNENTTEDLNFFAVAIELWQIDNSAKAPSFNVIVKPNGWAKAERENAKNAANTTPTKQLQYKFWSKFKEYIDEKDCGFNTAQPKPQHWFDVHLGRGGYKLALTTNSRLSRLGVEVYIFHPEAKEKFKLLEDQKTQIEAQLGFSLDWQILPESDACRIVLYKPDCDIEDETRWPQYFDWLATTTNHFVRVFKPILRNI
ncbi:DUF4268 domain-containing protein [Mesorhizobium japonicum]|uniref:DUF4268 domain-containing protein n=1 Tax=Mesorhizobium japonicum TaxID=2066070 RepID=UPI003B59194B